MYKYSADGAASINVTSWIGYYYGNLALSSSRVFVTGELGTVGLQKSNLSDTDVIYVDSVNYTLVSNLATEQLYALGDVNGDFFGEAGELDSLIPLDGDSGLRDSSKRILWFTEAILVSSSSSIFAGLNRMTVTCLSTAETYTVNLLNGRVTAADGEVIHRWTSPIHWLQSGVVEFTKSDQKEHFVYGSPLGGLENQEVNTNNTLLNVFDEPLGDAASIAVDNSTSRWYYFYSGAGVFGESTAVLGYADIDLDCY